MRTIMGEIWSGKKTERKCNACNNQPFGMEEEEKTGDANEEQDDGSEDEDEGFDEKIQRQ